jgi:hypothetical protein
MTHSSTANLGNSSTIFSITTQFLRPLRPAGPWLLVAIDPDSGAIDAETVADDAAAIAFVERWNGQRNLYYSLNPTFRAMNKKPSKKDISGIEFICADLDPNDGETSDAAKARYRPALAAYRMPPTAVIDSGNGIQGLWRLADTIVLNGADAAEKIKDAEARGKALLIALGAKPGTQNIDRILRLPGTINLPNEVKRRAGRVACDARLIEMNGAFARIEDFPLPAAAGAAGAAAGTGRGRGRPRTAHELPTAVRTMLYLTGDTPAGYPSRSELWWAFVNMAIRCGIDENKIVEECLNATYTGCSIYQHVADNGGEDYVKKQIEKALNELSEPTTFAEDKQVIRLSDGKLHKEWRAAEDALIKRNCPVYARGDALVWPRWRWENTGEGDRQILTVRLTKYKIPQMTDMLQRHAVIFQKFDKTQDKWHDTNPPKQLVEQILVGDHWRYKDITGIVTAPTMRADGTLITTPGYDNATQLWYKPTSGIELPSIGTTKAEAELALADLKELIAECAFTSEVDRSVALAAMMTPVLRAAFPVAPLFFISKPEPGTGGSYLIKIISTLTLGREAAPLNLSEDPKEMAKELSAAAYEAKPILNLNNISFDLKSPLLAQMATEGKIDIRPFGKNTETVECDCRSITVYINGNNIKLIGELVRRAVTIRLDAKMERPETKEYKGDPIAAIKGARGKYLAAIFTIVQAFRNEKPKVTVQRINGFEGWSELVAQPLVWLGEADPIKSQEGARARDPERTALRMRIKAVVKYFRTQPSFTANDIYNLAMKTIIDTNGRPVTVYPDLFDAFVNGKSGKLTTIGIGMMLSSDEGRIVDGESIRALSQDTGTNVFEVFPRPETELNSAQNDAKKNTAQGDFKSKNTSSEADKPF